MKRFTRGLVLEPGSHLRIRQRIFEEFRQVAGDYAHKVEGTGLALTLAKKFVEFHGGKGLAIETLRRWPITLVRKKLLSVQ